MIDSLIRFRKRRWGGSVVCRGRDFIRAGTVTVAPWAYLSLTKKLLGLFVSTVCCVDVFVRHFRSVKR